MSPILFFFAYGHLPEGPQRDTSKKFHDLAVDLDTALPPGAEKATALRKLLEGKDAAVRATLPLPPALPTPQPEDPTA